MVKKSDTIAQKLLMPINPTLVMILGIYTMVWGLWVLAPWWDAFGDQPHGRFLEMHEVMPEWMWGLIATVIGLLATAGIVSNYVVLRVRGVQLLSIQWFIIGILQLLSDWHSTGWITTVMISVYTALVLINFKANTHSLVEYYEK